MGHRSLALLVAFGCTTSTSTGEVEEPSAAASSGDDNAATNASMILPHDPHGEAVVTEIQAIEDLGLEQWEPKVRAVLLEHYDLDQSGALNTHDEIHRVVCEVWRQIDTSLRDRSHENSLREAYGFQPDQLWRDALGVDASQREHLGQILLDCGLR